MADSLEAACAHANEAFLSAMDDDLNTADAFAAIFDLVRAANTAVANPDTPPEALKQAAETLRALCGVLGLDAGAGEEEIPESILALVAQRTDAKKARDFAEADRLRDQIHAEGYTVEDTPEGPRVHRA